MQTSARLLTLLSQAETLTTPAQELQHLVAFVGVRDRLPQACRNHLCIVHSIFHACAWYHMQSRVDCRLVCHRKPACMAWQVHQLGTVQGL